MTFRRFFPVLGSLPDWVTSTSFASSSSSKQRLIVFLLTPKKSAVLPTPHAKVQDGGQRFLLRRGEWFVRGHISSFPSIGESSVSGATTPPEDRVVRSVIRQAISKSHFARS